MVLLRSGELREDKRTYGDGPKRDEAKYTLTRLLVTSTGLSARGRRTSRTVLGQEELEACFVGSSLR